MIRFKAIRLCIYSVYMAQFIGWWLSFLVGVIKKMSLMEGFE